MPNLEPAHEHSERTYPSASTLYLASTSDQDAHTSHLNSGSVPGINIPTDLEKGKGSQRWTSGLLSAAALCATLLLAISISLKPANNETVHANWQKHVSKLNEHNRTTSSPQLKFVRRNGDERLQSSIHFSSSDQDSMTTQQVRAFLERGEIENANRAMQSAQNLPEFSGQQTESLPQLEPTISAGMQEDLLNGDARFFRIFLYDSCDEDGDVVQILLNGVPFAVVPITNAGVTLSVPVGSGTIISLEGIRDGVGGITVACRTSQGDYFTSAMPPGGVQPISLVR